MRRAMAAALLVALAGAARAGEQPAAATTQPAGASDAAKCDVAAPIRVYIPRSVSVEGDSLRLGQITLVRCEDQALATKVAAIPMGRGPWPTERIAFSRPIILSRLATHGIDAAAVLVTGAQTVSVLGQGQTIPAADILTTAEQFLTSGGAGPKDRPWRVVRGSRDLILKHRKKITLTASLADPAPPDHVLVRVAAMDGTSKLGEAEVLFRRTYSARRAVATKEIAPGQTITADNTRVETVATETRPDGDWSPPYGQTATRRIPAGSVVHAAAAHPTPQPALVRRNQNVTMRITAAAFSITGTGVALQDGRAGESIRVRNIDSQRIITARVNGDGTVEPCFEEPGT